MHKLKRKGVMRKIVLFVSILFLVGGVSAFAWPNGNSEYAVPGTSVKLKFWVGGNNNVTVSSEGYTWQSAGTYRVSGNRLTVTFRTTSDRAFTSLSGVTWVFTIKNNDTLVLQDGSVFVKI
jgi:hypothetical protein